jgi:uncharacterized protein
MSQPTLSGDEARIGQDLKLAFLRRPESYPDRPGHVDVIETHMSWVFLTKWHAYKLKKPVRYHFLDFRTLEARRLDTAEEVRLNRRLAPEVYLDTVPLTLDQQGVLHFGGNCDVVDWLVQMRRLPAERMLDHLIRENKLLPEDIRRVADVLAVFYRDCAVVTMTGAQYRERLAHGVNLNYRELRDSFYGLAQGLVKSVHMMQLGLIERDPDLFDARAAAGRIVEGHGDLRPEHVCLMEKPVIFDCLEFNRDFRLVDPADELASLAMDCERLGAYFAGKDIFNVYEAESGDRAPERLLGFYHAYRACLRARLAILHTRELPMSQWSKWQKLSIEYLLIAKNHTRSFA